MIVGSTALRAHGVNLSKGDVDLDVWVVDSRHLKDYPSRCDYHIIPESVIEKVWHPSGYVTPENILTIKMSHLGWDIHWDKTKRHIIALLNLGYRVNLDLYYTLVEYWKGVHGDKSFLSLNKGKDKFFTDKVVYKYDHDYLHELAAHPHQPVYTKCLKEGEDVLIDKSKFDLLTKEEQILMFREEISVIAIERWVVNPEIVKPLSFYKAYKEALKRTITNLTKGWATDFIIMNIRELSKPDFKQFNNVNKRLEITMSVDMKDFEIVAEELGYQSIEEFVYEPASGDFDFGANYEWKSEHPTYRLKKSDIDLYNKLFKARNDEYETSYAEYKKSRKNEVGYEFLQQEGGGEGGSEYCFGVFKLKGKTYKAEWSYYSYDGSNYEDIVSTLQEVKPVEKTITVYE